MSRTDDFTAQLTEVADGKRRLRLNEHIWPIFGQMFPDDARAADARQRLSALLEQMEAEGRLSRSKQTDRLSPVPLPTFVTLPSNGNSKRRRPAGPWLPELSWTHGLSFDDRQYEILENVNRWLRDSAANAPVVPAEERSLQLFGDEKAIAHRAGGRTLWQPGRLDARLLRYENVPLPFPYRQVGNGNRVLMVENTAAFRTCSKLLAGTDDQHQYYAVAFGQGKWAPKTVGFAGELPVEIVAVDYWGDLDVEGLKIAKDTCAAAEEAGLEATCHSQLWRLLLECESVPAQSRSQFSATITAVLPAHLRDRAQNVLGAGMRIPQERLGYQNLVAIPEWWKP